MARRSFVHITLLITDIVHQQILLNMDFLHSKSLLRILKEVYYGEKVSQVDIMELNFSNNKLDHRSPSASHALTSVILYVFFMVHRIKTG